MEWRTRFTEMVGTRYPIMQGALAVIGRAELAAAVSEAGGLGTITALTLGSGDKLRQEIRKARALTDRPLAVNLSPAHDPSLDAMRDVAIEEGIPVIETAGYRAGHHGTKVKAEGLTWIHKVHTVRHAVAAERDGADAVCIMGLEGAGLKSPAMLTTLVSVAMAVRQVSVPVIAAGGIGDARTFLAMLALGAEAVQLGSAFCAVKECPLAERRKQVLVDADPYDPAWRDPILSTPTVQELRAMVEADSTEAIVRAAGKAERAAIPEECGLSTISLSIGLIDRIPAAGELIDCIISEAEHILTAQGIGGFKLTPATSS